MSRRTLTGLLIALFVLTVVTRAYHHVSHAQQWYERSRRFVAAVQDGKWVGTYQRRHPGVTTMAVGGLSMNLYQSVADKPAAALFDWAVAPHATDDGRLVAAGVYGLGVVLAGLTVLVALALRRLTDNWWLALTAAGLMVFEPFYLARSRILHIDGLLSTFMLLSAVLLLVSLQSGQRRYLVLSGLAGGLAVLSKTPALFLVPFTGLALLVHLVARLREGWTGQAGQRMRWLVGETVRGLVGPLLLWVVMMALPFALWPAMWVAPEAVLRGMFAGSSEHILNPHRGPIVLAGKLYYGERANMLFYPATLAFNISFVTATLVLLGIGHYSLWRGRARPSLPPMAFWLLVAYVFFFILQMSIAAKYSSDGRYILPVYPVLDILAAAGLVGLVDLVGRTVRDRRERLAAVLPALLTALVVGLQALVSLSYAPYYGAYSNHLLGGNRVAVTVFARDLAEGGMLYVSDYLNNQPNPANLKVLTGSLQTYRILRQYFDGDVNPYLEPEANVDYYLFDMGNVDRNDGAGLVEGWKPAAIWEAYRDQTPQLVVMFDGVEFLRLYSVEPAESAQPTIVIHRDQNWLIGVAWAWTASLLAVTLWALRHPQRIREPVTSAVKQSQPSG